MSTAKNVMSVMTNLTHSGVAIIAVFADRSFVVVVVTKKYQERLWGSQV